MSTSIFAGNELRNTSTKKCVFLIISDELAALPFGFLLFQIPKISSDVSTNQPISGELGTSLFLAFPKFPKMNRNAFTAFEVKRRPPILP